MFEDLVRSCRSYRRFVEEHPVTEATLSRIAAAAVGGSPHRRSVPVMSRLASSIETQTTSGVNSLKMAMTRDDISA